MVSEGQIRLDAVLGHRDPQICEAYDLGLSEGLELELGEGRAAPKAERLAELACGALRVSSGKETAAFRRQPFEPARIHLVLVHLKHVTGRARGDELPVRTGA